MGAIEVTDVHHDRGPRAHRPHLPFSVEVFYGERVGVLGGNGTGKSHLLRLLGGDPTVAHEGRCELGARVVPGHFSQTHDHPELHDAADQTFETLSGGRPRPLPGLR